MESTRCKAMKSQRLQKRAKTAWRRLIGVSAVFLLLALGFFAAGVYGAHKDAPKEVGDSFLEASQAYEQEKESLLSELPQEVRTYLDGGALEGVDVETKNATKKGSIETLVEEKLQSCKEDSLYTFLFGDYVDSMHNVWATIEQAASKVRVQVIKKVAEDMCEVNEYVFSGA